jgi:hypothetical protein
MAVIAPQSTIRTRIPGVSQTMFLISEQKCEEFA